MGIEPILSQLSASRVCHFRHICMLGVRTPPCYKGFIRFRRHTYKELEQVAGIEPAPSAWKADILAVIRYLHIFAMFLMSRSRCQGLLLAAYDLAFDVIPSILHIANRIALSYFGAVCGIRTRGLLHGKQMLYQTKLIPHKGGRLLTTVRVHIAVEVGISTQTSLYWCG